MKNLLVLFALLYTVSTSAQAKFGWGMKRDWSIGFYVESGNVNKTDIGHDNRFAIGLDVGAYVNKERTLLAGFDFGFGNTRLHRDGVTSLDANQHFRGLVGYKLNNWLQVRGAYGIGGQTDYRDCQFGGCSGWSTKNVRSWKASALLGPVELGYSNNGLVVGIKFIR